MKKTWIIPFVILLLSSCSNGDKHFINKGVSYWRNTRTILAEWAVYVEGKDTMTYITNHYTSGKIKSKVVLKRDGLWKIEFVLDPLGNPKDFGEFKNGTGCVVRFNDEDGNPLSKGCYINGNKEGWWKNYHFTGAIVDSTRFINGYEQNFSNDSALQEVLDLFGGMKNNLYQ